MFNQSDNKLKRSLIDKVFGRITRHIQQGIGSLGDLWRTPFTSIMTVLVLGISLTLPATLHVFVKNANSISEQWGSASEISLFLKLSVTDKEAKQLVQRLRLYPEINHVEYISAEKALKEFRTLSGFGEALNYLDKNHTIPDYKLMLAEIATLEGDDARADKLTELFYSEVTKPVYGNMYNKYILEIELGKNNFDKAIYYKNKWSNFSVKRVNQEQLNISNFMSLELAISDLNKTNKN